MSKNRKTKLQRAAEIKWDQDKHDKDIIAKGAARDRKKIGDMWTKFRQDVENRQIKDVQGMIDRLYEIRDSAVDQLRCAGNKDWAKATINMCTEKIAHLKENGITTHNRIWQHIPASALEADPELRPKVAGFNDHLEFEKVSFVKEQMRNPKFVGFVGRVVIPPGKAAGQEEKQVLALMDDGELILIGRVDNDKGMERVVSYSDYIASLTEDGEKVAHIERS